MINKTRFRVANDKKVLHKIGKRWVTVSALTLALLGGGAVASTTITHADANTPTVEAQQTNTVKKQLNNNLNKAYNANNTKDNQSGVSNTTSSKANTNSLNSASAQSGNITKPSAVQSQASNLHKGLMLNATNTIKPSAKSSASSSDNGMTTLNLGTKSNQARDWNFVQHGINNNDFITINGSSNSESGSKVNQPASNNSSVASNSASKIPTNAPINAHKPFNSAMQSYETQMSGADSAVAKVNGVNNDNSDENEKNKALLKDDNAVKPESYYFEGNPIKRGSDDGLNYNVYTNGGVEFTDGKANKDLSTFRMNSDVSNATAMKFDNNIDTSNVDNMSDMFEYSKAQSIDLGNNFATNTVFHMNNMFESDHNLQSLTLPNSFNTSQVDDMSDMFLNDIALKSLTLPDSFDTSDVSDMQFMFNNDTSLQSLKLPNSFDTKNVTNMEAMFAYDTNLQSLTLPNSFNTSKVSDMGGMFNNDTSLQSLTLPNSFDTSNVSRMPFIFQNDSKLSNQSIQDAVNKFNTGSAKDMSNMFENDTALKSLTLPDSFDTTNVTNMSNMFANNHNLQSLTLSNAFNTFNASSMSLTGIGTMSDMFNNDTALKSLTIKASDTSFDDSARVPTLYKKNTNNNYTSDVPNNYAVGTFVPENLAPVSDKINYQSDGKTISSYTTSKEKFNNTTTSNTLTNLPSGYHLVNPSQVITFNGNVQNIAVKPNPSEWDTISYEYQPNSNQSNYYEVVNQGQAYGRQGTNYTIQSSDVPTGYQLVNPNDNSFAFGNSDGFHRVMIKPTTNTNIPAVPNTVNIKGTVDLHFTDGSKTKDIKLDYLTQDSDDKAINLLSNVDYNAGLNTKPSDFVKNTNIQGFDVSNFTYIGATNNYDGTQYTPSKSDTDYNHGSTNLLVKNITLNFNAKNNTDPIQNGATDNIEYVSNGEVMGQQKINGTTGSPINLVNKANSQNKSDVQAQVPKGYQLVHSDNSLHYDNGTHNEEIVGKPISDTNITVDMSNGTTTQIPVNNHKIGDKITINPNQYAPAGYQANSSDNPITVTIVPSGNGQGYSFKPSGNDTTPNAKNNVYNPSNNTVSYNYTYDPDHANNTVTVQYKNQNGKVIGTKSYNVAPGTKITPDLPDGYNAGTNSNTIASNKSQTITYNVTGIPANQLGSDTNKGMVNLHIVEKGAGNQTNSYNVQVNEGSKLVGSDFTIDPTQSKDANGNSLVPKGYAPDSTDNIITGVITSNGAITDSGTDTFVYDAMGKNGYNIHYQDPSDPNNSKKDIVVPTNNDKTGQHLTNADVPHGYHLPSDTSFSFNSDGNIINDKTGHQVPDNRVPLVGDNVQGKANIVLKYQILGPTGKVVKTIYNNADDAQIILNGQVSGSEKINPWRYWKQDYTVPTNTQQSDTIHFTPSDVNANDENGQQFNPTLTYTATAQQAGDVVVQYVDVDEPIKDSKGNITGYQPIKLSNGKSDTQDLGNFSDLVGQTVRLGQKEPSDNNANINNDSDVKYVLDVPQGYHLKYNANPITLAEGQMASSNPAVHYSKSGLGMLFNASRFYHRPVGLFLTVGLSNPMEHKNNKTSSTTTNSSASSSSNSSASDSSSMIPAIATNTSSASSSASTNTASSLIDSLEGNTYITNNSTSNITNNYNYSNSSNSMATNSSSEAKTDTTSSANNNSARTTSDNADKSNMIDINNRPSKIIDTTTNKKHTSKVSNISKRLPMKNHYYVYSPKNIVLYGKHGAIKISRRRGFTGKILRITKFHGKRAYVISWKRKKFTVIARQTRNAYIQPKEFNHYAHGLIKHATIKLRKDAKIYKSIHFNKHTFKYNAKAGRKFTVVAIKSFGEKGYERTRLVLSNGLIINANKNYVEFI